MAGNKSSFEYYCVGLHVAVVVDIPPNQPYFIFFPNPLFLFSSPSFVAPTLGTVVAHWKCGMEH